MTRLVGLEKTKKKKAVAPNGHAAHYSGERTIARSSLATGTRAGAERVTSPAYDCVRIQDTALALGAQIQATARAPRA